jgi:hypothetical protein
VHQRPRQLEGLGIAPRGQPRQRRPAGIAKAQRLRALVERLARRIVHGFAEQLVSAHARDAHQLGVPARDQQRDERELRRVVRQKGRQQMSLEVVNAQRRPPERGSQGARHPGAHEQCTGQPRAACERNHIDLAQFAARRRKNLLRQGQQAPDVVARGQLGHDAAEPPVHVDLAVQSLRAQPRRLHRVEAHQRHAGLVARRLDAENVHCLAVYRGRDRPRIGRDVCITSHHRLGDTPNARVKACCAAPCGLP